MAAAYDMLCCRLKSILIENTKKQDRTACPITQIMLNAECHATHENLPVIAIKFF